MGLTGSGGGNTDQAAARLQIWHGSGGFFFFHGLAGATSARAKFRKRCNYTGSSALLEQKTGENGPKVARKKSLAHRLNLITQGSVAPKRAVALLFSQQAATPKELCPGPRQLPVAYPHAHIPGGKQPYVANAVLNG